MMLPHMPTDEEDERARGSLGPLPHPTVKLQRLKVLRFAGSKYDLFEGIE